MDKKLKDIFDLLAHLSRKKRKKLYKVYERVKILNLVIWESNKVSRAQI